MARGRPKPVTWQKGSQGWCLMDQYPARGLASSPHLCVGGSKAAARASKGARHTASARARPGAVLSPAPRGGRFPGIFNPMALSGRSPPFSPPHPWSGQGEYATGFSCKGPRPVPKSMDSAHRGPPSRARLAGDPSPPPPCQMSQLNSKKPRSPTGPIPFRGKMPPCHPATGAFCPSSHCPGCSRTNPLQLLLLGVQQEHPHPSSPAWGPAGHSHSRPPFPGDVMRYESTGTHIPNPTAPQKSAAGHCSASTG